MRSRSTAEIEGIRKVLQEHAAGEALPAAPMVGLSEGDPALI